MKKIFILLLILLNFLCYTRFAMAQPVNGIYVSGDIGLNFLQNETMAPSTALESGSSMASFNPGYIGVAGIGYGFGAINPFLTGWRIEIEGNYSSNSFQDIYTGNQFSGSVHGGQENYGAMTNILYDIIPSSIGINEHFVYPYLGVGVGYEMNNFSNFGINYLTYPAKASGGSNEVGNFAYQGIVGFSFPIAAAPGLSLTAEYRMLGVADPQGAHNLSFDVMGSRSASGNERFGNEFNHEILFGVRYAFGQFATWLP